MDPSVGPIHSRLADDPAHAEAVDGFVLALAHRVDDLQDLEARGDLKALAEQAAALGADAVRTGYPALERCTEEVRRAAQQDSAELTRKALIELTDVARRVRQGHRGSL